MGKTPDRLEGFSLHSRGFVILPDRPLPTLQEDWRNGAGEQIVIFPELEAQEENSKPTPEPTGKTTPPKPAL